MTQNTRQALPWRSANEMSGDRDSTQYSRSLRIDGQLTPTRSFRPSYGLLKKLYRMLSLSGYQFQSSSSVSCSMRQISSSMAGLETAGLKPLRTKASDPSENVQKVCKPLNNS